MSQAVSCRGDTGLTTRLPTDPSAFLIRGKLTQALWCQKAFANGKLFWQTECGSTGTFVSALLHFVVRVACFAIHAISAFSFSDGGDIKSKKYKLCSLHSLLPTEGCFFLSSVTKPSFKRLYKVTAAIATLGSCVVLSRKIDLKRRTPYASAVHYEHRR